MIILHPRTNLEKASVCHGTSVTSSRDRYVSFVSFHHSFLEPLHPRPVALFCSAFSPTASLAFHFRSQYIPLLLIVFAFLLLYLFLRSKLAAATTGQTTDVSYCSGCPYHHYHCCRKQHMYITTPYLHTKYQVNHGYKFIAKRLATHIHTRRDHTNPRPPTHSSASLAIQSMEIIHW